MRHDSHSEYLRRRRLYQLDHLLHEVEELHGLPSVCIPREMFFKLRAAGIPARATDTPTSALERIFAAQQEFLRTPESEREPERAGAGRRST